MFKLIGNALCLFFTVLLCSCASYKTEPSLSLKNNAEKKVQLMRIMPLLPVPKALQNRVWLDKFTFSLTGTLANTFAEQQMLLQTELTNQGINLAAMSFSGALLAQASWLSGKQTVQSEIGLAKDFNAKQVMHDLQISHWPIALVKENLLSGFSVNEQQNKDRKERRFYYQGEVIIIIHYSLFQQNQKIDFQQLKQGYQLSIQHLSDDLLKQAEVS